MNRNNMIYGKQIIGCLLFLSVSILGYAQRFVPDDARSSVKFTIKNFGIGTKGSFSGLTGEIQFDPGKPAEAVFNVCLDARTVDTDNSARDKHLRKESYFHVDKYPQICFISSSLTRTATGYVIKGKFNMKGISKEISFPCKAIAREGGYLFTGECKINRLDFNIGTSSTFLSDNLVLNISVFAKKG